MSSQQPDSPKPTNESPEKSDADNKISSLKSQSESYGCSIALLIVLILLIIPFQISQIPDVISGFRSYFWKSTQGTIIASNVAIDAETHVGSGHVVYRVEIDGKPLEITKKIRKDWPRNRDGLRKAIAWMSNFTPGKQITVYYDKSGWTALERGPSGTGVYVNQTLLMITGVALLQLFFLCYKVKRSKG